MTSCLRRIACVFGIALILTGCGNKETKQALQQVATLESQKQYQDANDVLLAALRAREAKVRAGFPVANDETVADAQTLKVQQDTEILKLERAQVLIYLHLERADLASAVYKDIVAGHPGDSVVNDAVSDPDALVRIGAVRVLGLAGKPESIPLLVGASKDTNQDVRRAAVAALGSIKDPTIVPPLLDALKDSYWFVRSDAAEALGRAGDLRALKPLLDAVTDSDGTVESSAENALLLLCGVKGISAEEFAGRLRDPNPKIVVISAVCLAVMHDSRAIPVLLQLAASSDSATRLHAVKALGESGDPSAIPMLRQTLKDADNNVRGWSIIGLGKLRDQGSTADLQAISADEKESPNIREAAGAAVAHITGQDAPATGP